MSVHIVSGASAIFFSLRYAVRLGIRIWELPLYLRKSLNLALCYTGFLSEPSWAQARQAGKAGFLTCAYDVVTDWRGFQPRGIREFSRVLRSTTTDYLRDMALGLLEKDKRGELAYDGLERGITSVRFITELIGSQVDLAKHIDLDKLGMALQIVDDILDYEADTRSGDLNCLVSSQWRDYIRIVEETLPEPATTYLFPYGNVLRYVIKQANTKAQIIISSRLTEQTTRDRGIPA